MGRSLLTAAALCLLLPAAHAQYKCVQPSGGTSFQQQPCDGGSKGQKLDIRAPQAPEQGVAGGGNVDQRMAAAMVKERRVRELEQEIAATNERMNGRNDQMSYEIDRLRNRHRNANNNLAGATYQQSLSTEMTAVAQKYKAMNDLDIERLKQLNTGLAAAKAANR